MASILGSILSGGATGAAAGASSGNPMVTLGTGIAGALGGLFTSLSEADSEEEKRKILEQAAETYNTDLDGIVSSLEQFYNENPSIGSADDITKYKELVADYDPNEFVYDFEDFDSSGYNINDYYAPNRSAVLQNTADMAQATAAGQGVGRGTGAVNNIASALVDKNEELAKNAQDAMNQDRQFAYQIWNSNIQNNQNRLNQLKSAYTTQMDLYGDLAQNYQDWNTEKMQNLTQAQLEKANNNLSLQLAKANI